jgi:hypothetical protein
MGEVSFSAQADVAMLEKDLSQTLGCSALLPLRDQADFQ